MVCDCIFVDFMMFSGSFEHRFSSIWEPLGTILAAFGSPWAPFWHYFGDQIGHRCTQRDPGGSQGGFLMILGRFWVPFWGLFWSTFWHFLEFELSKSMVGLQAQFLMIFDLNICWFVMSKPFKNIVNTVVFIRFHIFDFCMNLMILGTNLDLILDTFGGLGELVRWFVGVLEIPWNFSEFHDLPRGTPNWGNDLRVR